MHVKKLLKMGGLLLLLAGVLLLLRQLHQKKHLQERPDLYHSEVRLVKLTKQNILPQRQQTKQARHHLPEIILESSKYSLEPPSHSEADQQVPIKSASFYSKTNRWIVVRTDDKNSCDKLAHSFHDWNIVIASHQQHVQPGTQSGRCTHVLANQSVHIDQAFLSACKWAIKNKAEMIYALSEVDNLANVQLPVNAVYESKTKLLSVQSSEKVLNFGAHFGCSPKDLLKYPLRYSLCTMDRPAIQAFVNICSTSKCDETAPAVALQSGQYGLVTLNNALFFPEAFWALPLTTSNSITLKQKIESSFLTPKRLWMIGSRLMVHNSVRGLPTQCLKQSANVKAKKPLSLSNETIYHGAQKASNAQFFFKDNGSKAASPKCSKVHYHPLSHNAVNGSTTRIRTANLKLTSSLYEKLCSSQNNTDNSNLVNLAQPWTQFADILLIVVFNNPLYDVIPVIELLYRPMFPLILYCGPREMSPKQKSILGRYSLSFVTYGDSPKGHNHGSFFYRCPTFAMEMGYRVSGYLTIADDLLLFPHKFPGFRRESVWFLPQENILTADMRTLLECKFDKCDTVSAWFWWSKYKSQGLATLETLQKLSSSSGLVKKCYRQLLAVNRGEFRLNGAFSDVFYIPGLLQKEFKHLAPLFLEHQVFVEIAIPSIIRCLEKPGDVVPIPGNIIWNGKTRNKIWHHWTDVNVRKTFLHPTKWSYLLSTNRTSAEKHRQMFCDYILPFMHDQNAHFRGWQ